MEIFSFNRNTFGAKFKQNKCSFDLFKHWSEQHSTKTIYDAIDKIERFGCDNFVMQIENINIPENATITISADKFSDTYKIPMSARKKRIFSRKEYLKELSPAAFAAEVTNKFMLFAKKHNYTPRDIYDDLVESMKKRNEMYS